MQEVVSEHGRILISVITPAFNEEDNLPEMRARLHAALDPLDIEWEWLVVDDHSTDGTWRLLRKLVEDDPRLVAIRFSRNFGSHQAIACALQHASGQSAVIMGSDLQDPPETLPLLIEHWRAGNEVVWAVRQSREGVSTSTRFFSTMYYWIMRRFALPEMPAQGADFLLIDRKAIDAYNRIGEKNASLLATILWMGFRQTYVEYVKRARHSGKSKWTLAKKLKLPENVIIARDIADAGNTSAASIPLATHRLLLENPQLSGGLALQIGFGAGLVFGAQVIVLP